MPTLVCYDCEGRHPGEAKIWIYPCRQCAGEFVEAHRSQGHDIRSDPAITFGDRIRAGAF